MAENHLDYDYLEDEAIDEHFAEDPVGVGMSALCGERCRFFFFVWLFAGFCARASGRRWSLCAEEHEPSINCGFRVVALKTAQIDEPNVVQRAEGRAHEVHADRRGCTTSNTGGFKCDHCDCRCSICLNENTSVEVEVGNGERSGKGGYLKHNSALMSPVAKGKLPFNTEGNTANPDES